MVQSSHEKELIQRSLKGEEGAFDQLVHAHRAGVFRHCLQMLKDEAIAQDMTQETFVHAFQHLSSFRMEAKFSTWLWRIAHNLSLNYLKKHPHLEEEFHEELLYPQKFLKVVEIDEEKMQQIASALRLLSPKQRIVFEMYALQHIPQKQIAVQLGISHGTVRSRLYYARKKIRDYVISCSNLK
jgi:RNA polymerase sigma-70 factor (ECF subfamily)